MSPLPALDDASPVEKMINPDIPFWPAQTVSIEILPDVAPEL
jgi:hypothetical protein